MSEVDINDKRKASEFKGVSFSKFQKTKVKKELINCLLAGKVESACYWSAELVCAGHYSDLWDTIILYITRYIHLGNPKLPIYIAMRFETFRNIICNGYADNEILLRNNQKVRQIFAEIAGVLCFSRIKHSFEPIKIKKTEEFNMATMAPRLKAPSIQFASSLFKHGDPKELYIATNEFAYHIGATSKDVVSACYWLEWILEFESICKKKKEQCLCERRTFAPVQDKYQMDPIWIVWDAILCEVGKKDNTLLKKIVQSLLTIFSIKYTSGVKKRRRFVIYFAIALLTEPWDGSTEMINNGSQINQIVKKINTVYKDVKKNEESPNTEYLFAGTARSNLDKTIERLEKMSALTGAVPRS